MDNLPLFIRRVREAQGINQSELSKKIGITQSAIAQFEKLQASLSPNTILKTAPILNLNPNYIEMGIGNPFKQAVPQIIIKMFLPEDPRKIVDYSLVKAIANANKRAAFFFLKPSIEPFSVRGLLERMDEPLRSVIMQWRKHRLREDSICALFVQDDDDNYFLFKRKNNLLFNEKELSLCLQEIEAKDKKYFESRIMGINQNICRDIVAWSDTLGPSLIDYLHSDRHNDNRRSVFTMLDIILTNNVHLRDREVYENIKKEIVKMSHEEIDELFARLTPEIARVISDLFHSKI